MSSGFFGIFQGPVGNPYPGGDGFFLDTSFPVFWNPLGPPLGNRSDIPFQTFVEAAVTPEPGSLALLALGAGVLLLARRRRIP